MLVTEADTISFLKWLVNVPYVCKVKDDPEQWCLVANLLKATSSNCINIILQFLTDSIALNMHGLADDSVVYGEVGFSLCHKLYYINKYATHGIDECFLTDAEIRKKLKSVVSTLNESRTQINVTSKNNLPMGVFASSMASTSYFAEMHDLIQEINVFDMTTRDWEYLVRIMVMLLAELGVISVSMNYFIENIQHSTIVIETLISYIRSC